MQNVSACAGLLSDVDIRAAIASKKISITPFDCNDGLDNRLTPCGFNFSFSRFVISKNDRLLIKLHLDKQKREWYFYLNSGDTALALTYESIWVSKEFGGTFHSKVTQVTQGLGNISTTLDPGWHGQLLISLNNPSKHRVKVVIGEEIEGRRIKFKNFITLYLYRLETPAEGEHHNDVSRLNVLDSILRNVDSRNKRQNRLIDQVRELKDFLDSHQQPSLNEQNASDHAARIECFKENHALFLMELDARYEKLAKASVQEGRVQNWKKAAIWISWALLIIVAFLIFVQFVQDEKTRWLITILVALVMPFSTTFIKNVLDTWGKEN